MPRAGGSAAGPERMLVARVDVDRPLPALSAGTDPYPAAWVIAFRHGRPSPVAAEVRTPDEPPT